FHRLLISQRARAMVDLVCVLEERFDRTYVAFFALSRRVERPGFFDSGPTRFQLSLGRRRPDWMVLAHRDTPISHATLRIERRHSFKGPARFFIAKRVQPCSRKIEMSLSIRIAGNLKAHMTKIR